MQDISFSKPLFGSYAETLGPTASAAVNRSLSMRYYFIEKEHFNHLIMKPSLVSPPNQSNFGLRPDKPLRLDLCPRLRFTHELHAIGKSWGGATK